MIRLLVDTCCDMLESHRDHPNLDVVSLNVIIDGKSYRDQKEIGVEEIVDVMNQGIMPGTSQVSPGDFIDYFTEQAQQGNEVIYFAFSKELSGTYRTALLALDQVRERYPDFRACVVDSRQSGGPIGLVANELLDMIDQGATLEELEKAAQVFNRHTFYLFTMQNLRWLAKGGRLGKATAHVGDLLKIRPVILVRDGIMEVIGKVRGDRKALKILSDRLERMTAASRAQLVGIGVCDERTCLPMTEKMEKIVEEMGFSSHERAKIGTVLTAHLGMTGTGVFFWDQDPKQIMREHALTVGGKTIDEVLLPDE